MTAPPPTPKGAPHLPVVEMIRSIYADPVQRIAADWGQMFGHIQTLLGVIDGIRADTAARDTGARQDGASHG